MDLLCLDFINSQWYKTHKIFKELLEDENWLKEFYKKCGLPATDIPNKEIIDTLLELRSFLSRVTNDLCTQKTISLEAINKINEYLTSFSFCKVLKKENEKYYLTTIPNKSDLNCIIFEITSSFVEMITEYQKERIKLCENPECKWIFYDESKSHTRKWCDNTCATLMKVRRFRENKKINNKK